MVIYGKKETENLRRFQKQKTMALGFRKQNAMGTQKSSQN
jgi:hypothetical protein